MLEYFFNLVTSRDPKWPRAGELKTKMADIHIQFSKVLEYLSCFQVFCSKLSLRLYLHQFNDSKESLNFKMRTVLLSISKFRSMR